MEKSKELQNPAKKLSLIEKITLKFIDITLKISEKILPKKILKLEEKLLTVQTVLYIFFGVLTTIVNVGSFAILTALHMEENCANIIAIILAVLFAYITNKDLVFNSAAVSLKEKTSEFIKFILGRAVTMVLEIAGFALLFNALHIYKIISKLLITVIVIVLNFFISKFFAFKQPKKQ